MEKLENCSYEDLKYDEACVELKSQIDRSNLWLYTLSSDCVACPYTRNARLIKDEIYSIRVNMAKLQHWRVLERSENDEFVSASDKNGLYCQLTPSIGQFGIYEFTADHNNSCQFRVNKEPVNPYTSLAIASGIIILLLGVLSILKLIENRITKCRSPEEQQTQPVKAKRRVGSLDTVRGMSILLMIFVNNGAAGYAYLEHATWNGLYVGDLVFPCFMWIMGVCIPLSISSQLSRGSSGLYVCRAIVKRSFYLFFIGICLNTLAGRLQLENIRIFGVLQRFSLSYLVAALVYTLAFRGDTAGLKDSRVTRSIRDVIILLPQWIVALLILAAHCVLTFQLSVPGCPKGYLGPGGRQDDGKYTNCTGGAAGYVDRVLLGQDHIYQWPTARSVYGSGPFDPEGILGCLTSIFQVFLGIQAGQTLREFKDWRSRLLRWLIWAVILGLTGSALHYSNVVPVNKNLWSISFVMVTTCFSLALLSACYLLIDVLAVWRGGPFRIPGMNALVMYVGHQVFFQMLPFHWRLGEMNTHEWLLAESLWCVGLWTCIAYILHRKRIYVAL